MGFHGFSVCPTILLMSDKGLGHADKISRLTKLLYTSLPGPAIFSI